MAGLIRTSTQGSIRLWRVGTNRQPRVAGGPPVLLRHRLMPAELGHERRVFDLRRPGFGVLHEAFCPGLVEAREPLALSTIPWDNEADTEDDRCDRHGNHQTTHVELRAGQTNGL